MANLFWVAGTAVYDGTTNRLATTSGGAASVAVIAAGDTVTFDANSPASAAVTTSADISCTTLTLAAGFTGSLTMSNTLDVSGTFTLTQGTLNTNGQAGSWSVFSSQNSNVRGLNITNSAISVTGTGTVWTLLSAGGSTGGTNATVTATGSTITFSGAAPSCTGLGAGGILNNVVFSGFTGQASAGTPFTQMCTNLTVAPGATKSATFNMSSSNTYVITGTFTLGGNTTQGVNRLLVAAPAAPGTQRNITAGAYVITGDVDFMDMNLAYSGAASWTNAGSAYIGDAGGNSGAVTTNATTPATQTATGTASFTWSTHGWTSRVPLPQDDVVIDNAFVAGRTITVDMPRLGKSIDTSSATGSPAWSYSTNVISYGGLDMSGMGSATGSGATWTFLGRSAYSIKSAGKAFRGNLAIGVSGAASDYTLLDGVTFSSGFSFTVNGGTFYSNGQNISALTFGATGTATLDGGNGGTWSLSRVTTGSVFSAASGNTFQNMTGTIIDLTGTASGVTLTFAGAGKTYGTLRHISTGSAGLTITGNNTFASLELRCTTSRTITFPAGGTQTITADPIFAGTPGQLLTIVSSSAGSAATLSKASGIVVADYLSVQDSTATGGASWYAGTNSTDVSGNTGWIFTGAVWPRRDAGTLRQSDTLRQTSSLRQTGTTRQT